MSTSHNFYIPALDRPGVLSLAFIVGTYIYVAVMENSNYLRLTYSKFTDPNARFKISSRKGMLMMYTPSAVISLYLLQQLNPLTNGWTVSSMFAGMYVLHFIKRLLEVLFVHQYSGTTDLQTTFKISGYYAGSMTMAIWQTIYTPVSVYSGTTAWRYAGLVMFVVGILTNVYHHLKLAAMRSNNVKKYVMPSGGLFEYVACPHYFGECVELIGIGLFSQNLFTLLIQGTFFVYLWNRSNTTNAWYRSKFPQWPASRKNLIPFLY